MRIKQKKGTIEAFDSHGKKIGSIVYNRLKDKRVYLNLVAVHPKYRQKGILRQMYPIFENKMKEERVNIIEFDTGTDESHKTVRNFFERRGYVIPTQEEKLPGRIHMKKNLN